MKLVLTYLPFLVFVSAALGDGGAANRAAGLQYAGLRGVCLITYEGLPPPPAEPIAGLTLVVYKGSGDEVVAKTTSDAGGRFAVSLRPGPYRIVPQRPVRLDPTPRMEAPVPDPLAVEITPGRVVEAVLICHCHSQTVCD
jgi:hypothetical protein